jgi:hypothetical protein
MLRPIWWAGTGMMISAPACAGSFPPLSGVIDTLVYSSFAGRVGGVEIGGPAETFRLYFSQQLLAPLAPFSIWKQKRYFRELSYLFAIKPRPCPTFAGFNNDSTGKELLCDCEPVRVCL